MNQKSKLLSVITIAYNSQDFIEDCITSVLKYLPENSEYIILNNNSTDKTLEKIKKFIPKIKLIESEINLGFAKGVNKASSGALGEYLFFLNPDTKIETKIFEELIDFYQTRESVGIVSPKLKMLDGNTQPSVKKFPTIIGAFKEFILGIKQSYTEYVPIGDSPQIVDCVYGAAVLIKTDLFERIGRFNEQYFMYYEDVDLCRKVKVFGKLVYYYPIVSIRHIVGGTKSTADKYQLNLKSARVYHGLVGDLILHLIFLVPRIKRKL